MTGYIIAKQQWPEGVPVVIPVVDWVNGYKLNTLKKITEDSIKVDRAIKKEKENEASSRE